MSSIQTKVEIGDGAWVAWLCQNVTHDDIWVWPNRIFLNPAFIKTLESHIRVRATENLQFFSCQKLDRYENVLEPDSLRPPQINLSFWMMYCYWPVLPCKWPHSLCEEHYCSLRINITSPISFELIQSLFPWEMWMPLGWKELDLRVEKGAPDRFQEHVSFLKKLLLWGGQKNLWSIHNANISLAIGCLL